MADNLSAACKSRTLIVPQCSFVLEPDDSFTDRCGEIYITRKRYLVFHCCYCAENYGEPNEYVLHLYQHYAAENHFANENDEIADATDEVDEQTLEDIYESQHDETINSINDDFVPEQPATLAEEQLIVDEVAVLSAVVNANVTSTDAAESNANAEAITKASVSKPTKHICDICGLSCKSASNLKGHKRRHNLPRQFACYYCAQKFHTSSELREHERRHRGEKRYMCELCATSFYTSSALNQHYNRHNGHRAYTCAQCQKSFFTAQTLKRHYVVHTQERKYACNLCTARFPRLRALRVHQRLHENRRKYVCHICKHSFNQRTNMHIHLRGKHKVDLPENYIEPLKQKDYMRKKNREKLYSCAYCTKEFDNLNALAVHRLEIHDNNNNESRELCKKSEGN